MANKKYELMKDDTIKAGGKTLYRIKCVRSFKMGLGPFPNHQIPKGCIGGYIESEKNLSHDGGCWVDVDAMVYGNAEVSGNAQIMDEAMVYGKAKVFENALVHDDVKIYGNARVYGSADILGSAQVYDNASIAGEAAIDDNVKVYGKASLDGGALITGDAEIFGNSILTHSHITTGKFKDVNDIDGQIDGAIQGW